MQQGIEFILQNIISDALQHLYSHSVAPESVTIQATRKEFEGQYTVVVFPYLRYSKLSPEETAQALGAYLLEHETRTIANYNVVKGFLNLTLTTRPFLSLLQYVCADEHYGMSAVKAGAPLYMVEYSSPNTNKPLHLGHIRNNLLGYSISKILEANGYQVVKTNIVNDRGIHICKSMLAWQKWGDGQTPQSTGKKGDHLVGDFYVLFDKHYRAELQSLMDKGLSKEEAETESALMAEAREMLRKWESGDPEIRTLWHTMNEWVYAGFNDTYKRLGVSFDKIYYESDTYTVGKEEVLRGLSEGVFVQDPDGSVWADLTDEGLDRKILLRADGTSVYMTQDIGTAKMRYNDYPIDQMIYVVGNEQNYHFQVLSLLLDKLGFAFGKSLKHFSYGMVELPNGKMKSREGTVVDADDLMDNMCETAYQVSQELGKNKDLDEKEMRQVAEIVGQGALKYFLLKVDPKKNMLFDPEESIDFNGNTGPFIQYTYARISSIQRKAKEQGLLLQEVASLTEEQLPTLTEKEIVLLRRINEFPAVIRVAGQMLSPAQVANYIYDLVKEYNQFYHDHSILNEPDASKRTFRLALSYAVAQTIRIGMGLLGIQVPERM